MVDIALVDVDDPDSHHQSHEAYHEDLGAHSAGDRGHVVAVRGQVLGLGTGIPCLRNMVFLTTTTR